MKEEEAKLKNEIIERLIKVFDYKGVKNAAELTDILKTSHTRVNNYFKGVRIMPLDSLSILLNRFKDLNARWIITGEGDIINKDSKEQTDIDVLNYIIRYPSIKNLPIFKEASGYAEIFKKNEELEQRIGELEKLITKLKK